MNFREGNLLQAALIDHLDPGHHNRARAEFVSLEHGVMRRAMNILEGATPEPLTISEETVARLTWILGEQLNRDPRDVMREMIHQEERAA